MNSVDSEVNGVHFCTIHIYDLIDEMLAKYVVSRIRSLKEYKQEVRLTVNISTSGGYLKPALDIAKAVANFPGHTRAIGQEVASSAVHVYLACQHRLLYREGTICAHNAFWAMSGGFSEVESATEEEKYEIDRFNILQAHLVSRSIGLSFEETRKLLESDITLNSSEAYTLGFARHIISDRNSYLRNNCWAPSLYEEDKARNRLAGKKNAKANLLKSLGVTVF